MGSKFLFIAIIVIVVYIGFFSSLTEAKDFLVENVTEFFREFAALF